MLYNIPYVKGDDQFLELFIGEALVGYDDNRNFGGRKDIQLCQEGMLYRPWYYRADKGNAETNAPRDINSICLVYKVTEELLDPKQISHTDFYHDIRKNPWPSDINDNLTKDLEVNGQQRMGDCIIHRGNYVDPDLTFADNTKLKDQIRIFESHHRAMSLEKLGRKMWSRVWHLYDMPEPINYDLHYNSTFDDNFWSSYNKDESQRTPWFDIGLFRCPHLSAKFQPLVKCLDFIKALNINLKQGIDIGCAEGVYTNLVSKELKIPMLGIDSEDAMIVRGMLAKLKYELFDIAFLSRNWNTFAYSNFDFAMLLSILHHIDDPIKFLTQVSVNKRVMIIEARVGDFMAFKNNTGKVEQVHQPESEVISWFDQIGMKHHKISEFGERFFYVLWR